MAAMLPLEISKPLARLLICGDYKTCGQNAELNREWLEDTWRAEELHGTVALKITTCQDRCDHASVARVFSGESVIQYGGLKREHYEALVEWARECKRTGMAAAAPALLADRVF